MENLLKRILKLEQGLELMNDNIEKLSLVLGGELFFEDEDGDDNPRKEVLDVMFKKADFSKGVT